jgi:hypothetical protein
LVFWIAAKFWFDVTAEPGGNLAYEEMVWHDGVAVVKTYAQPQVTLRYVSGFDARNCESRVEPALDPGGPRV